MVVIRRELPSDSVTRVRCEIDLPQWHIDEDSPFRVPFGRFILFNKSYLSGCCYQLGERTAVILAGAASRVIFNRGFRRDADRCRR
jgi:hypothetical protein